MSLTNTNTTLSVASPGLWLGIVIALLVVAGMVYLLLLSARSINKITASNLFSQAPYLILGTLANSFPGTAPYISLKDIYHHMYILGTTGSGKSYNIIALLLQLYDQNVGWTFIDIKDTWDKLLRTFLLRGDFDHSEIWKKLVLIQFTDDDQFLSWNILGTLNIKADTLASQIVEAFHRMWQSLSLGQAPLFDVIMTKTLRVLIDNQLPITAATKLLTNKKFREKCLVRVLDKDVVDWFHDVFDNWGKETSTNINSTLTRIDLLANSDVLKYTLGQLENGLPLRQFMDEGKFVVFSLEGVQNPQARNLLGCLLVLMYEYTAYSRHNIPEYLRVPHFLFIDEFADFSTSSSKSFESMLSKTRGYKLFLTLCHQQLDQASERLLSAVQNCDVKMAGSAGRKDAELLSKIFGVVDPTRVLLEPLTDRSQPVMLSKEWQWEEWTQRMELLPKRHFMVKVNKEAAVEVKTIEVPTGDVDEKRLEQIKQKYHRKWMNKRAEITLVHQHIDQQGNIDHPDFTEPSSKSGQGSSSSPNTTASPPISRYRVVEDDDA